MAAESPPLESILMKIAIFGRLTDHTDFKLVLKFFRYLQANGIEYAVDPSYAKALTEAPAAAMFQ